MPAVRSRTPIKFRTPVSTNKSSTDLLELALKRISWIFADDFPVEFDPSLRQWVGRLFMEASNAGSPAPLIHISRPLLVFAAITRSAFSAVNHPFDIPKVQRIKRTQCGFVTNEMDHSRILDESSCAVNVIVIFNTGSEPHIPIPVSPVRRQEAHNVFRPFGQKLPIKMWCISNQLKDHRTCFFCHGMILENIAKRSTKDAIPALFQLGLTVPLEWFRPCGLRNLTRAASPPKALKAHAYRCQRFCVTVLTSRADFYASHPRIESKVRPSNSRMLHTLLLRDLLP